MPTKNQNPLPQIVPLPGAVCLQYRRCGKRNCRCTSGSPHPFYARFWREGGRLRKQYVKRGEVEAVQRACEAHRRMQAEERHRRQEAMQEFREAVRLLRHWYGRPR